MITEIKIQNFKLFKSFHLKDLPQILIIGGKNNSGKTSVLEAIYLSLSFNFGYLFWKGLSTYKSLWFRSAFPSLNPNHLITFEYTRDNSLRKVQFRVSSKTIQHSASSSTGQTVSSPIAEGVNISYWKNIKNPPHRSLLYMDNKNLFWYDKPEFSEFAEKSVFLSSTLPPSLEEVARNYSYLMFESNMDSVKLQETLQILEPKLLSLSIAIPDGKPMIYGNTNLGKIPLHLMGEGMNRLAEIFLHIYKARNGIVLIDELENGFHYSILPSVWEKIATLAKANNTQIIATTHSRELIAGAVEGIPKKLKNLFQYRRIEKIKDADFKSVNYDLDSLKVTLDSNLAIR